MTVVGLEGIERRGLEAPSPMGRSPRPNVRMKVKVSDSRKAMLTAIRTLEGDGNEFSYI